MDINEIPLLISIIVNIVTAVWAIYLHRANKKNQKQERRFIVYSNFMNKLDELNESTRNDPNLIYGIKNDYLQEVISGDSKKIGDALLKFNKDLQESLRKSINSTLIINQELNKLTLVASDELLEIIEEYKLIIDDYNNEIQNILGRLANNNNFEQNVHEVLSLQHDDRIERIKELYNQMIRLMRKEIG